MTINTLSTWHKIVREQDLQGLNNLLAEDVVFLSPVAHTPKVGKEITKQHLSAAFAVLCNDSFRYVREISNQQEAVLEFVVDLDGLQVNGVDLIKWNKEGLIVEFKVMLRPLKAIHLLNQKMAEMLQMKHS